MKTLLFTLTLLHTFSVEAGGAFHTVPMNQKSLSTYYVKANLHGSGNVEFLVDTGAGYTTINENTLDLLKSSDNATYVGELTAVLADGSQKQLKVYEIASMEIGGCQISKVKAAVFPKDTRMLLGLTALEKTSPFIFSTNPPALSLSNCNAK